MEAKQETAINKVVQYVLLGLVVFGVLLIVDFFKCVVPTFDAQRILARVVAIREWQELGKTGKVGDLDSELRSDKYYQYTAGLDHHQIIVKKIPSGYDVVLKPRSWCFCRTTFILHDRGNWVEAVPRSW